MSEPYGDQSAEQPADQQPADQPSGEQRAWDHDVPSAPAGYPAHHKRAADPVAHPATPPAYDGFGAPEQPQEEPQRRTPRLLAAGTAVAVVLAAGGAGFAVGHHGWGSTDEATGAQQTYGSFGLPSQGQQNGQSGEGSSPFGGTSPFGNGSGSLGQSPYDSSATTRTAADADQLTGLVRVATTLKYEGGKAAGTGMILTSDGEVITNHHVVEGATKVTVKVMSTGKRYAATVVGTDAKDDVAVLQLQDASGLSTVTTDDDGGAAVGDSVTAVGDAGGSRTTFSQASGKVTALGQSITTRSEGSAAAEHLKNMMKISSDVISGDSGGPTYDAEGEVVGMTTAASSGSTDVVGFAIPITKVLRIAGDLENGVAKARYTYGTSAFLGVGLGRTGTSVVGVYRGTPAAKAGIEAGDTITAVDGTRTGTSKALRAAIAAHQPGQSVAITWRDEDGASHTATITLTSGPVA